MMVMVVMADGVVAGRDGVVAGRDGKEVLLVSGPWAISALQTWSIRRLGRFVSLDNQELCLL